MNHAPGPKQKFALPYGPFWRATKDTLNFWLDNFHQYGDVVRWQFGKLPIHFFAHPDHVQLILQDHYRNYPHSRLYDYIKMVTGEGLLTSEGDPWKRDRRMIQSAFHHDRLVLFTRQMAEITAEMLVRWEQRTDTGEFVDISQEMMRLTMGIISQTMFSRDISGDADILGNATTEALSYLNYRVNHLFAPPLWVPTGTNRRFKQSLAIMDRVVLEMIEDRRSARERPGDLLTLLIETKDEETGHEMTNRQIRDQIVTFMGAGHETTAVALSWTWGLLSLHQSIRDKVIEEVDNVLQGRIPQIEDLPQLRYTGMVVQEAMRLYPPASFLSRRSIDNDRIGGFDIPGNTLILVSQWVTHRHPNYWPNPEGFDPDRFQPEKVKERPKYAYFPFSGGPRKCIGDQFALMEAKLIVAMVLQKYHLDLQPGHHLEPVMNFTLRPRGGMPMTIHRRKGKVNHSP